VQGAEALLWSRLGTQTGLLAITGAAELDGGLLLGRSAGAIDLDRDYGVLSAGGGITGTFAQVGSDFAFLEPRLTYATNAVSVHLQRNSVPFSSVAVTSNQRNVGESLGTLGSGPIMDGILSATKEEARVAFSQLSGEAYASTFSAQIGQSVLLPAVLFGRMAAASGGMRLSVGKTGGPVEQYASLSQPDGDQAHAAGAVGLRSWAMLYGNRGYVSGDANAGRATTATGGIFTGLEYVGEEDAHLGVAFGYGKSNVAFATSGGRSSSEDFRLAAYGAMPVGDLTLAGGAALGWHDNTMERRVTLPGFGVTDRSTHATRSWQIFGEAAYGFRWDALRLSPYANLTHAVSSNGSFRTGGGSAALTFDRSTHSQTFMTLGLRGAATLHDEDGVVLRGKADFNWRRALRSLAPVQTARFEGATPFEVRGAAIDRDVLGASVGLGLGIDERMEFDVTYTGQFGKRSQDHGVSGRFSLRF
jgi:fibronectin-binding autotransporter adhesin